jgi:flavin-dependent dehydrogenase
MHPDFDVVIVGARVAGAATALLLARAGASVLVVDKSSYGSDTLSTHALMRGAVMQLTRWTVLESITAAGTPPVRSTQFVYPSSEVTVAIEPRYGVEALYAPRRTVLDKALVDSAAAAGAQFAFRTPVTDLAHDATGRVNGIITSSSDGTRCIRAGLVVGADGVHSAVAKHTGAPFSYIGAHATGNLYSYWEGLAADGYEWHYNSAASVGTIPTNSATCVFLSIPSSDFARDVRGNATTAYERLMAAHFPAFAARLDGARRVEPIRGFGGLRGFIRRATGPGWALVGDAGYFKDPLTAHGITDALRDAELLARAVLRGDSAALTAYETARDDLSRDLFTITDRIASFDWSEDELQGLHRAFSREMSREQRALAQLEPPPCPSPLVNAPLVS